MGKERGLMHIVRLTVDKLHDYHCVQRIKSNLGSIRGIHTIRVSIKPNVVVVEYAEAALSPKLIIQQLELLGHQVKQF